MKRILLFALLAALVMIVPARAQELSPLHLTLTPPEGLTVFARDMAQDDPALGQAGLTLEELLAGFENGHIYANYLHTDPLYEYLLTMTETGESRALWDAGKLEDGLLEDMAKTLADRQPEAYTGEYSLYRNGEAAYMVLTVNRAADGAMGRQYVTVRNGQMVALALYQYDSEPDPGRLDELKALVDSMDFEELSRPVAWTTYLLWAMLIAGVGLALWALWKALKNRK